MDPTPNLSAPQLFSLAGQNVLITGATRGMFILSIQSHTPTHLVLSPKSLTYSAPLAFFFLSPTGIGAACAIALAQAGASICLVRRPNSSNDETANAISATGSAVKTVECDLGDLDAVRGLFQQALEAMGGEIHVLVNCAGIQRRSPAVQFAESDWDDVRLLLRLPVFPACAFSAISLFISRFELFLTTLRLLTDPRCSPSFSTHTPPSPLPAAAHHPSSFPATPPQPPPWHPSAHRVPRLPSSPDPHRLSP